MLLIALGIAVFLALYWSVVPACARRSTFAVAAIALLAASFPASVAVVVVLALATRVLADAGPRGRAAAVAACLVALAAHKYAHLPLPVVGLSYAVFRLIHVVVEEGRGQGGPRPRALLEYVLFPPAFLSGPIARYPEFEAGVDVEHLDLDRAFWGLRRILYGLAKKVYLVEPLRTSAEAAFVSAATLSALAAWKALFAYSLFVYLDFSAYCDLALGVARLFGFSLPENFAWPYLAADITDFWRRWHMTLTRWLRDYLYVPLSARLTHVDALRRSPLVIGAAATLVTMLVCGLWHGDTASFALWGLGHGVLLTGHLVYGQRVLTRLPPRRRRALASSRAYAGLGTVLTFVCVSLLWVLFRFPPREAAAYYGRLAGLGVADRAASAAATVAFSSGE